MLWKADATFYPSPKLATQEALKRGVEYLKSLSVSASVVIIIAVVLQCGFDKGARSQDPVLSRIGPIPACGDIPDHVIEKIRVD